MRIFREVIGGVVFTVITTFTVLGGIGLAFIESDNSFFAPPGKTQVALLPPTETLFVPSPVLPVPTSTPGPEFSPTPCNPPAGWSLVVVGLNETLLTLASRSGINAQAIILANCLTTDSVFAGQLIYLPAAAPAQQPTVIACGPPPGWRNFYTVQPGENLFRISLRYGVSLDELIRANCLSSTNVRAGQNLFVPPIIIASDTVPPPPTDTLTPFVTFTPSATNTAAPNPPGATDTATATTVAPTARPTTAIAPTFTHTVAATATEKEEATPTDTLTPTPTETATEGTPTDTPTATESPPTDTPTATESPPTPTDTPVPTETPTDTPPPQ